MSGPSKSATRRTVRRPFAGKYPTEADFFFHTTDLVGQTYAAFYNKTEKSLTLLKTSPLSGPPQTYIVPGAPTVVKCRDVVPIYVRASCSLMPERGLNTGLRRPVRASAGPKVEARPKRKAYVISFRRSVGPIAKVMLWNSPVVVG